MRFFKNLYTLLSFAATMAEDYESESIDFYFGRFQNVTTRLTWITLQMMTVWCYQMAMVGFEVSAQECSVTPLVWESRSTESNGLPVPLTSLNAADAERDVVHCTAVDSTIYPDSRNFQPF